MKGIITSLNIFLLISIIFFLLGIVLAIFAFDGIAIAITFFTKILLVLAVLSFCLSFLFYYLKKKVKVKIEDKNSQNS